MCVFLYYNDKIYNFRKYLSNRMMYIGNSNNGSTKRAENIVLNNRKIKSAKSLFYEGIKMYNKLSSEIKQSNSLVTFKLNLLREYIIGAISRL